MSGKMLAFCLLTLGCAQAADLTTRDGKVYRNYKVVGHDDGYLTIMYADGGGKIPLSDLPADLQKSYGYDPAKASQFVEAATAADRKERAEVLKSQAEAARRDAEAQKQRDAYLASAAAAKPATSSTAASSGSASVPLSAFASKFDHHLVVLDGAHARAFDVQTLAGVKYWAFYYSASWCPPCRAFTPELVSFYGSFKKAHPNFELIFVSHDRSEADTLAYMKMDAMPWPTVRFDDIRNPGLGVTQYCGSGIPCLVLVDADGRVLSDSFRGEEYLGPQHVVADIQRLVQ